MRPDKTMRYYRKKFLILIQSVCEYPICTETITEFYDEGFLPTEWLDILFMHITFAQYDLVAECIEHMYPHKSPPPIIAPPGFYDLAEDVWDEIYERSDDTANNDSSEDEIISSHSSGDHDVLVDLAMIEAQEATECHAIQSPAKTASPQDPEVSNVHSAQPQKRQKNQISHKQTASALSAQKETIPPDPKRYDNLNAIVQQIFLSACKKSLHPSGCCIEVDRLQQYILSILPDHTIVIDSATQMITLNDENGLCVLSQRTPEAFPCTM